MTSTENVKMTNGQFVLVLGFYILMTVGIIFAIFFTGYIFGFVIYAGPCVPPTDANNATTTIYETEHNNITAEI